MLKPPKKPAKKAKLQASTRRAARPSDDTEEYYDDEFEPNMKLSRAFIVVLLLHVVAVGGIFAFNNLKSDSGGMPNEFEPGPQAAQNPEQTGEMRNPSRPAVPASNPAPMRNTPTAPIQPASPQSAKKPVHVVRSGETLTTIAALYAVNVESLKRENRLENTAFIRVGQQIVVPEKTSELPDSAEIQKLLAPPVKPATAQAVAAARPATGGPATAGNLSDSGKLYYVEKGDNPYAIARKLNVSYTDLLKLNNIDDPKKLQIGQALRIPGQ